MTDRRRQTYDQAAFSRAADRVVAKVEEVVERMDARLDRIEQRQTKTEAQFNLDIQRRDNDLNELRRDVGELRDAVRIGNKGVVVAAAKGFWATRLGKVVVVATGVTAVITAGEKIPKAARAIDDGWTYIVEQGREQ